MHVKKSDSRVSLKQQFHSNRLPKDTSLYDRLIISKLIETMKLSYVL